MVAWESVQKTLDWIEDNLTEEINICRLSELAGLSEFYYQKLFSRLVGKTVFDYIKSRRLEKAANLLLSGNIKVIDTSIEMGFENHETFSRAFKEAYGITPSEYKKSKRPLKHFYKPDLSMLYTLIDENTPLFADGIILEVCRKKVELKKHFKGLVGQCQMNSGIDLPGELWERFLKIKGNIQDLCPDGNMFAESFEGESDNCFSYFVGAETQSAEVQDGFVTRSIPTGDYIVCGFEAESFELLVTDALIKASNYMREVWLPKKTKIQYEDFLEIYYPHKTDAYYMELWIRIAVPETLPINEYDTISKAKTDNTEAEFFILPEVRLIGKSVLGKLKIYDSDPNMIKFRESYQNSEWRTVLEALPQICPGKIFSWGGEERQKAGEFKYCLGVMVPPETPVPSGFEYRDFPSVLVAKGVKGEYDSQLRKRISQMGFKAAFNKYPWMLEMYYCNEDVAKHWFHWLMPCCKK